MPEKTVEERIALKTCDVCVYVDNNEITWDENEEGSNSVCNHCGHDKSNWKLDSKFKSVPESVLTSE